MGVGCSRARNPPAYSTPPSTRAGTKSVSPDMEAGPPDAPSTTDRTANLRIHDSIPETVMPDGNKSRVSGDGLGSNRPTTNFPGISVDQNRVNRLVEQSGLGVEPRPLQSPIKQGESGISGRWRSGWRASLGTSNATLRY